MAGLADFVNSSVRAARSSAYNTPLDPYETEIYNRWLQQLPANQRSTYDYDLPGLFKAALSNHRVNTNLNDLFKYDANGNPIFGMQEGPTTYISSANGAHLNDYGKKPWHDTFSNESRLHGLYGFQGGKWSPLPNNRWVFQQGNTNRLYHNEADQIRYFRKAEPNNVLLDPLGRVLYGQY